MSASPEVDAYLAPLPDDQRAALEALRRNLHALLPGAEECISYGVPALRYQGHVLVGFGAARRHCTLFPMSGATVTTLREHLSAFETSKGAIRFQPASPPSVELLRLIVETRRSEINDSKQKASGAVPEKTGRSHS